MGENDLRERAEASALERAGSTLDSLHELRVHQIELEMQNEELRKAQTELEAARSRYFDLYDLAPVGYFTLSENGLILEANLGAASDLGLARGELVKKPISRFIFKDDQDGFYLHRKKLVESGEPQAWEMRLLRSDGSMFWAHLSATAAADELGAPLLRVAMRDIAERKRSEEQISRSLAEKEVLLRELHHRVKNSLTIISSLLHIQSHVITSPEQAIEAFRNSGDRILAMSLVYNDLYLSSDYARVDMDNYLKNLARQILLGYGVEKAIRVSARAEGIVLNVTTAIPCGLILNELITNAVKYAFPDERAGEIRILFREADEGFYELSVSDDGVGMPPGGPRTFEGGSLGHTLIQLLAKQLDGSLEIRSDKGTSCSVRFPRPCDKDEHGQA